MYNTWHGSRADCGSFHSYQSPNFSSSCASFHDLLLLLLSRIERETLSLSVSLSAVLSATFLIKRPPRTVSSTAPCPLARNIKIPGRRSRAGFDRSNEFPSKSSRPTCDAEELVVAVTAIARSKTFQILRPDTPRRAHPRASKHESIAARDRLMGVLFL